MRVVVLLISVYLVNAEYNLSNDVGPRRARRYVLARRKWDYDVLTWRLHSDNIAESDRFIIRSTLHRAFSAWSSVSSLKFIELTSEQKGIADLSISFLKGRHGDELPFDGPDGIVAHAFYPTVGVLHFDADEKWTLNRDDGINLYQTALHEIGHLLGLEHSTDPRAVMFPKNRPFNPGFELADDDVRGIRRLYAPPKHRLESTRLFSKLIAQDLKKL
ncbi:unnamed protein product [Bursaphelenchus xylophilus]|uniref:(pine wood nematode) hypothetical protein n=1 Tax=Bursaphelenchus xylophilus TaxID=6326 RepID=A0A1I7RZ63_BURXY|nr:unnamed protein product [Bursaphelenchus xylophilus]CAG9106811.1 unnamed protein product [Bursaphelenchus xylophilus]